MLHNRIITENKLDAWVRGNAEKAQGIIVELIWRLISASSPQPKERRFPLGDSIGQHGPDGVLNTEFAYNPFVPEGISYWEIGTGQKARDKATSDYKDLTENLDIDIRRQSTFIFVTPLSGKTDWEYSWKKDAQATWLSTRRQLNDWRDVRIIDGTCLIDWLQAFPAVELWLAEKMGIPAHQIQTLEQRWDELRTIGYPPPLTPHIFLIGQDEASARIKEIFSGTVLQLRIDTHYPKRIADFVAAYVEGIDEDLRVDIVGCCLIISGPDAWNAMTALQDRHILVADFDLDEDDGLGTKLLDRARRAGHVTIFGGYPGGLPHPSRVFLPDPNKYQIQKALEKSGYNEERARVLAQKSGGNIDSLLRCLQNLSLMPEWAQNTDAAELAIAEILGSWKESSEADRTIVECMSGNPYGEWIGKMREVALRPSTPLAQQEGVWKFVARYEGWYALGPRLFDEHLDRLKKAAVGVLKERDPKFELPPEERFMASIRGKVPCHSPALRKGLAESLALLGSHPEALTSCSTGKAEGTAKVAVREIFTDANWVQWASLNDLLPLLAEAAPREFIDAVENALSNDPCPFDMVFAQEDSGIMGNTYMSGLLWALETLAWDPEHLARAVVLLGDLATRDPGGNWNNRPANSLSTILLPWFPQTCAPIEKRNVAVKTLIRENPDAAWNLLLSLLPGSHQFSSGSYKPRWRSMIPDDYSKGVTQHDYWEQITTYANLAIEIAKSDRTKLFSLIDHLGVLPSPTHELLLDHLGSEEVTALAETERLPLWNRLMDVVIKHRKYAGAAWAMRPEQVDRIAAVAERLKPNEPALRYQRLFSESDFALSEKKGDYQKHGEELDNRRKKAVDEIYTIGGVQSILDFATTVESAWRVGIAFGHVADNASDQAILPDMLTADQKSITRFAGGYVLSRFGDRGWQWIDEIDTSQWNPVQIGQLLAYLPFTHDTWERASQLLGDEESPYWTRTNANPYDNDENIGHAVDRLIEYGRPVSAIRCLANKLDRTQPLDTERAVRALLAALNSSENISPASSVDIYQVTELIKALQDDPHVKPDDLYMVECAYLPLLDGHNGVTPKCLEQRLAKKPDFFCKVIRAIYHSNKENISDSESTEEEKRIATSAYHLLSIWKTPPGSQEDGSFNSDALKAWLDAVKTECEETGHIEMAMSRVGQVLIHAPPDPDGLWIHHSVAEVLNTKGANGMRDSFRVALYNARGAHFSSSGKQERVLAEKYRSQAEEVENHGYSRLAGSLRTLAESYERDAEWEANWKLPDD